MHEGEATITKLQILQARTKFEHIILKNDSQEL